MTLRGDSDLPSGRRSGVKRPEPADGPEIRLSARAAVLALVGFALLFAWGLGLLVLLARAGYGYFVDGKPIEGDASPKFVLMFSLALIVVSSVGARSKIQKLRRGRRVLLGRDRFQLLEDRGDETQVVASIPYENIEQLKCTRTFVNIYILNIKLYDTNDMETYLPGVDIEANYSHTKFHYSITDQFEDAMPTIADRIERLRKRLLKARKADSDD